MLIYIYILILLCLMCAFKETKWPLAISFVALLVVAGFRDLAVGTDTQNYESLFNMYGANTELMGHATEPLYLLLHIFVAFNGWGYSTLMFLSSLIVLAILYVFAIKESPRPHFTILCFFLLYYFFYSFNTVRQFQAMMFVLLAWHYQTRSKYKLYYTFMTMGVCFHFTAFVGLLSLIIEKIKLSVEKQTLLLILSYFLGITPIVKSVLSATFSFLPDYFYSYIADSNDRELTLSLSRFLLTLYVITLINLLKGNNIWIKLLVFGVLALNLFAFQPVVGRIAQFFTIVQITIIPQIPNLIRNKRYSIGLTSASIMYMLSVWLYLLSANTGEVLPYMFGGVQLFALNCVIFGGVILLRHEKIIFPISAQTGCYLGCDHIVRKEVRNG